MRLFNGTYLRCCYIFYSALSGSYFESKGSSSAEQFSEFRLDAVFTENVLGYVKLEIVCF